MGVVIDGEYVTKKSMCISEIFILRLGQETTFVKVQDDVVKDHLCLEVICSAGAAVLVFDNE